MYELNFGESREVNLMRVVLGIISVIGNGTILHIAMRFEKFRSTYCNCLIALLAFAEFLLGLGLVSRALYSVYINKYFISTDLEVDSFLYNPHACVAAALPQLFGIMFAQVILLAMAIDRLLAVYKPAEYKKNNKQMRIFSVNVIAFSCGIFFCLFAMFSVKPGNIRTRECTAGANNTKLFQTFGFCFGLIIAAMIYAIYLCTVCMIRGYAKINDITMGLVFQRQRRVFVSISLILFFYAIFWCLPIIFVCITNYTNFGHQFLGYNSVIISLCSGLNSCVGIFVYLAKHHELRRYYLKIYCSMCVRISREDSHISQKFLALKNQELIQDDEIRLAEIVDL